MLLVCHWKSQVVKDNEKGLVSAVWESDANVLGCDNDVSLEQAEMIRYKGMWR